MSEDSYLVDINCGMSEMLSYISFHLSATS